MEGLADGSQLYQWSMLQEHDNKYDKQHDSENGKQHGKLLFFA
jgi:hypothetical protein